MRREVGFLLIYILIISIFSFGVYAQEEIPEEPAETEVPETTPVEVSEVLEQASEEFKDAELEENSGITPDSGFYFVEDGILSRFRDDSSNREKKIAEIKAMIEEGNVDAARVALKRYREYADNLEREVDPEKREEARRSAAAIRNVIEEIQNEIPANERGEFVNEIIEREGKIVTSAEIAGKIKELCVQLSELDPLEYSRVCQAENDAPRWQRDMNRELTAEQEQEAKRFFEIMSQCFDTSGRQCKCEEISVSAFSEKCSTIAPLAAACDEGNEEACSKMEKIEQDEPIEDLLPDYLQDVLARAEGRYDEDRYDLHMPPECIKEGADTPKKCIELMFRNNAPGPCLNALDRGEISFANEKEAREACDKIMFEENAPPECVKAGATNPKECGKIMFREHAPEECIEVGITGENRGDDKKCREIMESQRVEGPSESEGGFGGGNCRAIQDSMKRLECYDSASQGTGERVERVEVERREVREYRQEGGQKCPDNVCDEFEKSHSYACPEDCGGVRREEREPEEFKSPEEFQQPPEGEFREGEFQSPTTEQPTQEPSSEPSTSGGEGSSEPSSGGESSSSESGGESAPTGAVISNEFYDYYYR